jgi:uncharacterized protein (DUF433 family)
MRTAFVLPKGPPETKSDGQAGIWPNPDFRLPYVLSSSKALCSARTAFGTCFSSIRHVYPDLARRDQLNVHLRVVQRPEHAAGVTGHGRFSGAVRWSTRTPMRFERITVDAGKMSGLPCIRGLRIPVPTVVGMVADGMTEAEILAAYPDLEPEDICEALHFAA